MFFKQQNDELNIFTGQIAKGIIEIYQGSSMISIPNKNVGLYILIKKQYLNLVLYFSWRNRDV